MSLLFLVEISILFFRDRRYNHPPKKNEYEKYFSLTRALTNNTLTLATLTIAILLLFVIQGSHVGTQTLLIYGLSLLFLSAFLNEFVGLKKIVYFVQRRILHYWFYSIILAILTIYVNPLFFYASSFDAIFVILVITFIFVVITHIYSFYLELDSSRS